MKKTDLNKDKALLPADGKKEASVDFTYIVLKEKLIIEKLSLLYM